jgi:acyl dehydratase
VIDPKAVGRRFGPYERAWTSSEAILYALGVGSGSEELQFTTENTHDVPQAVLPTFGVVLASPTKVLRELGRFNWGRLVHVGQRVTLHGVLPADGVVSVTERIKQLWDKGKGKAAIVVTSADATGRDGKLVLSTEMTLMLRGEGGFGGDRGPSLATAAVAPEGLSDEIVTDLTSVDQALLYRLSGDRNPLHSDPWFASTKAGYPKPILHGLCTYGYAGRALVNTICKGDVSRVSAIDAQFSAPVFPGEELTTEIWRTDDGARFRTLASPDKRIVLHGEVLTRGPGSMTKISVSNERTG